MAGPSDPLTKTVAQGAGLWLANYGAHPWMLAAPILGFAGAGLAIVLFPLARPVATFLATATCVFGVVATAGVSMFPFLLPSSLSLASSLTVWDASSSRLTLGLMLVAALVFVPIVILYTAWVYRVLRGRVSAETILGGDHSAY